MAKLTRSIASLSWIDPITGLPEVDENGEPGYSLTRENIAAGRIYRFANFLEAEVELDKGALRNPRFTSESGMYRGPSFGKLASAPVGKVGKRIIVLSQSILFRQIVGCRTESPEKIGSVGGAAVGVGAGAWVGAKSGAAIGSIGGVPGAIAVAAIGAGIGGTTGYLVGKEVAEYAMAFPPIWTELEMTIHSDGTTSQQVISHSLFPSVTFYLLLKDRIYNRIGLSYDGVANLDRWKKNGWKLTPMINRNGAAAGNPWGMEDPGPELGGGKLRTQCPSGYDCP
ncbi:hypothetical protein C8R32_10443 [Nitrosospira sp. Nsp5]|uniref:Glycine zipper domain-containing protein n=1 Tax=Nitrosospira multiformis TaxID=1231 RepID=A0ABY0TE04_9PROT|nr:MULTISPECIES: glycine zipper domain-containing protein [Nitrosospira]PTR08964.1 hypothetical protein C8R32_10443 [Nitrosospira sp. Nsp5]SDQ67943.1 hypothetical protein SAMN05216402_1822 [Nitrosospira multiformis]